MLGQTLLRRGRKTAGAGRQAGREQHPKIVAFWRRIDAAAAKAVWHPGEVVWVDKVAFRRDGDFLYLRLPSSRKIAYPFPSLIQTKFGEYSVSFFDNAAGKWTEVLELASTNLWR